MRIPTVMEALVDDIEALARATRLAKGDVAGHPFRGNQHTDGGSNGASPEFHAAVEKEQVAYLQARGATDKAKELSKVADKAGTGYGIATRSGRDEAVLKHEEAAVAHRTAEELNRRTNPGAATYHRELAQVHSEKANTLKGA